MVGKRVRRSDLHCSAANETKSLVVVIVHTLCRKSHVYTRRRFGICVSRGRTASWVDKCDDISRQYAHRPSIQWPGPAATTEPAIAASAASLPPTSFPTDTSTVCVVLYQWKPAVPTHAVQPVCLFPAATAVLLSEFDAPVHELRC